MIYNYLGTLDLYEVYVQYDYCIKILDLDNNAIMKELIEISFL